MQSTYEAKAIMNGQAIDTCPRRRQAVQEITKHAINSRIVKVKRLTHSVVTVLKETFLTNPHHEDYTQIVKEAIDELIKTKFLILSRNTNEIHIADDFNQFPK